MKELVTERLASWIDICMRILLVVSPESSWSLGYVSITNADSTAENKPAYGCNNGYRILGNKGACRNTHKYQKSINILFDIFDPCLVIVAILVDECSPPFAVSLNLHTLYILRLASPLDRLIICQSHSVLVERIMSHQEVFILWVSPTGPVRSNVSRNLIWCACWILREVFFSS